jgi:hypothetical protein
MIFSLLFLGESGDLGLSRAELGASSIDFGSLPDPFERRV